MVMIFAHEKVRAHLLEKGIVYTFRKDHPKTSDGVRKQIGDDWATDRRTGKKIADIHITPVEYFIDSRNGKRRRYVLVTYVEESGFDTVEEWTQAIKQLNPNQLTHGWIYKVTLREAS